MPSIIRIKIIMNEKAFIDLLEHLTDAWPGETIDVDSLAEIIHGSLSDACSEVFIREHGGCCLACAIDTYFEKSEKYCLLEDYYPVSPHKMVKNL
jgi:hypothetical protein